jgi:hypothetical protein
MPTLTYSLTHTQEEVEALRAEFRARQRAESEQQALLECLRKEEDELRRREETQRAELDRLRASRAQHADHAAQLEQLRRELDTALYSSQQQRAQLDALRRQVCVLVRAFGVGRGVGLMQSSMNVCACV